MSGLTAFQVDVARLFFALPASDGFLLAGGGALLASGLTDRPTNDLDFFGAPDHVDVTAARDQSEHAIAERGWRSERLRDSATFVRLHVTGAEELIVEFAIDSAAVGQASIEDHTTRAVSRMESVVDEMRTDFDVPMLQVATDQGYRPGLDQIIDFVVSDHRTG